MKAMTRQGYFEMLVERFANAFFLGTAGQQNSKGCSQHTFWKRLALR